MTLSNLVLILKVLLSQRRFQESYLVDTIPESDSQEVWVGGGFIPSSATLLLNYLGQATLHHLAPVPHPENGDTENILLCAFRATDKNMPHKDKLVSSIEE